VSCSSVRPFVRYHIFVNRIFKNEPILMQIGTSDLWDKSMKRSTLGVPGVKGRGRMRPVLNLVMAWRRHRSRSLGCSTFSNSLFIDCLSSTYGELTHES